MARSVFGDRTNSEWMNASPLRGESADWDCSETKKCEGWWFSSSADKYDKLLSVLCSVRVCVCEESIWDVPSCCGSSTVLGEITGIRSRAEFPWKLGWRTGPDHLTRLASLHILFSFRLAADSQILLFHKFSPIRATWLQNITNNLNKTRIDFLAYEFTKNCSPNEN